MLLDELEQYEIGLDWEVHKNKAKQRRMVGLLSQIKRLKQRPMRAVTTKTLITNNFVNMTVVAGPKGKGVKTKAR